MESLNILELGLANTPSATEELAAWRCGAKSPGLVRKFLEREVWPKYGKGLWTETWAHFYRNLAGALQEYAHYTSKLMEWQWSLKCDIPNEHVRNGTPVRVTVGAQDEVKCATLRSYTP